MLDGEPRPVDLLVDETGEIVVNNVHVGVGAQASRKGAQVEDPARRRSASARSTSASSATRSAPLLSAFHPPSCRLRVEVDGEVVNDVDRPVLMVAIGNGANVGGGTELNPDADPEDGRLDVMISRRCSPTAKLGYVAQLRQGEHDERDDVRHPARHDGLGERRGVLVSRGRRDLRPRAQPQLAPRAGGVHHGPAPLTPPLTGSRRPRATPPRRSSTRRGR